MQKRLFIVSNRLPITVSEEQGIQQASGGLITAIDSYLAKEDKTEYDEVFWAGIPGCSLATWITSLKKITHTPFSYVPVFTSNKEYDGFYNGHANSVLWPLFHYFPSYAEYSETNYEYYQNVNAQFAETLLPILR